MLSSGVFSDLLKALLILLSQPKPTIDVLFDFQNILKGFQIKHEQYKMHINVSYISPVLTSHLVLSCI